VMERLDLRVRETHVNLLKIDQSQLVRGLVAITVIFVMVGILVMYQDM